MSKTYRDAFRTAAGLALVVLLAPQAGAEDVRAGIEGTDRLFEAAVGKGDGAAMAALFTADAQLLPANSDVVSGTAAIQKFWQGVLATGVGGVSLKTLEAEGHGATAHEIGQYEIRDPAGKVVDKGKYVVIWKRDGARWKLHRDIWTTSLAPARP